MTPRKDRPRRIRLKIALMVWLGSAGAWVLAGAPESIPWRTDFPRAESEARAQKRLLWVQFTGSWCPNCVRLERESFVHPAVVGHARNFFVPVKIVSDQHDDLVERFGLTGIPATILVGPGGEVVARHEGYVDVATFQAFLERTLIKTGRVSRPPLQPQPQPVRQEGGATTVPPVPVGRSRLQRLAAQVRSFRRPGADTARW